MPGTGRPPGPGRGHKRKIGNGQLWGAGAGESSPRKSLPLFGRDRPQPAPEAKSEGWVKRHEAEARGARIYDLATQRLLERLEAGEDMSPQELVAIAKALGDRAFGQPKQSVEVNDHRSADDLSDAELAAIAAGSGEGAPEAPGDPGKPH